MLAIFSTIKKRINSRGVSLIEAVLYITLLILIMSVIVQVLVSMGGVYKNIKLTRELESSGAIVMENMLREIRNASSVVVGSSVLGTNPGILKVSGIDEALNIYPFDHICGSQLEFKDGVITGKLEGKASVGEGKLNQLKELIEDKLKGSLKQVAYYCHSHLDLPVFEQVGKPVAVNPTPKLESLAKSKKWEILKFKDFEKN